MKPLSPFAVVTGAAAVAAALVFVLPFAAFLTLHHGLYLAAMVVGATQFLGVLAAVLLAKKQDAPYAAIWLPAVTQTLSALVLPVLLLDVLVLSALLLLMVPLSVCLSGRLRTLPLALVLSPAAMGGALAADLYSPLERVALFEALPMAPGWVTAVAATAPLVLAVAVARFRLRPSSPYYTRINIASQQALLITGVAAPAILLTTAVLAWRIREAYGRQAGEVNRNWAVILAERIADDFEDQLRKVQTLAQDEAILAMLRARVAQYPDDAAALAAEIEAKAQRWREASAGDAEVMFIRSNEAMMALARFRRIEHSHNHMRVLDRHGALVAAQGARPDRYAYGDTDVWRHAWNRGIGSSHFEWAHDDDGDVILMSVAVWDHNTNEALGVIVSRYQFRPMLDTILQLHQNRPLDVLLIEAGGGEIAREQDGTPATARDEDWAWLASATTPAARGAGWLLGESPAGGRFVIGYAPLSTTSRVNLEAIQRLGWRVILVEPQSSAFTVVTRSTKTSLLLAMLILAASVWLASLVGRVMSRPIGKLKQTATAMVAGDLNRYADPRGSEETATLAEAFNSMTAQLRRVIEDLQDSNRNLEDKVRERTARLRRTQRGLIDGAHSSGMAEIATSVLHNIGNILNTLNVSVETGRHLLGRSQEGGLTKLRHLSALMARTRPQDFLEDRQDWEKMQQYLEKLLVLLDQENRSLSAELDIVHQQARLIHKSLTAQSAYVRDASYSETLDINEVINDILMADTRLEEQFKVHIHREFVAMPPMRGVRSKLSYAFLCLVENACEAMAHLPPEERRLIIKTSLHQQELHVSVRDNGIGIAPERLQSIFQYGATTKSDGNGFGLHSCANAMREMGGRVLVHSEGEGYGATFTLAIEAEAGAVETVASRGVLVS